MTSFGRKFGWAVVSLGLALAVGCGGNSSPVNEGTPAATLAPSAGLTFAVTPAGTTATAQTATLTNSGNGVLLISGISITGANAGVFTAASSTCGTVLAAGATCSISVTFSPTTAGTFSASLSVADNASGSPQSLPLAGTGAAPGVSLSPSSLTFKTFVLNTRSQPQTVTLTNNGTATLNIASIAVTGTNASSFAVWSTTCGATLAPVSSSSSGQCLINITFTPLSVGTLSATLSVTDNASGSPQTVALTGVGEVEPNSCTVDHTTSPSGVPPTPNYPGTALTGTVLAGLRPIAGASVQIYSAGTAGNGSAPTPLGTPIVTDSNGNFSVPGSFTCPYSNSTLYAVARGGAVSAPSGLLAPNPGIVLATMIGACNSLTGTPHFTLNEATTAATAWAMAQFLSPGGNIGATSTNAIGLTTAAATAAGMINMNTGSGKGASFPSVGVDPIARIDSVANLLNACVASGSNGSTACTQMYTATTTTALAPSNTLDAALNLVTNPGLNVGALYTLSQASSAFSPALTAAPADWTLALTFSGAGLSIPGAVSVDSLGNVWVSNYDQVESVFSSTGTPLFANGITGNNLNESYGQAIDVNNIAWVLDEQTPYGINSGLGAITLLNINGTSPATYSSGGIYFPLAIAFDRSGNAWVVDYGNPNAGVVLLSSTGTPLSGTGGYGGPNFDFPAAVVTDALCNAYVAEQSSNTVTLVVADGSTNGDFTVGRGPSGLAIDALGNVWSANYSGSSVGLISSAGKVLSGSSGITGGGVQYPQGIAVDGAGHAWVGSYRGPGLGEFASAASATPGAALSPAIGWGTDAGLLEAFGVAIDQSGNIWISNAGSNLLTEFVGLAVPVKTPMIGPVRLP